MEEQWDAYDAQRQLLIGRMLERSSFPYVEEVYHLAVNVWVRHVDGDWLFMKRAANKAHFPNVYEAGAGGSVLRGELSIDAAQRELMEETGLVADQLEFLFSFTEKEYLTHFDTYLAYVSGEKDALTYQTNETAEHVWIPTQKLASFLESEPVFTNQKRQLLHYIEKGRE